MNRPLKFRAWDVVKKEWIAEDFSIIGEITVFDVVKQYQLEQLNDIEITQFTGLKDKNKREIYEADIITFVGCFKARVFIDPYRGVLVRYLNANPRTKLIDSMEEPMPRNHEITVEVIGNIYQDAHLLNGIRRER